MNTKSIRFRLTLWYSVAFFLAAFVIFSSFYLVTKQSLYSQTDATLASHGGKVVEVVTRKENALCPSCQMMAKEAFLREFSQIPGMVVILMDSSGNIVGSSVTVDRSDIKLNEIFRKVKDLQSSYITDYLINNQKMRFWISPVNQNNQFLGVVFVGHPIDVIEKSLTNLLVMLVFIFIIFMIPTIVGGYFLAQSAVKPITAISHQLAKISSQNLEEKVTVPKTNDEIAELAVTFNNLLDRLNLAFKRERQFIGDVAHELKTPLATQRSNIEVVLAKERTIDDYKQALLETLIDNKRLTTTVNDILDLAWSEAENTKAHFKIFNFSELIEEIYDLTVKMALSKHIKVSCDITPGIKITGEKDKLFRAIINIVDNAIKYSKYEGKVVISLHKTTTQAHLQIKDNGIGIERSDLSHVFERFYRGQEKNKTTGSGLGLSIAAAIIRAHGGEINIKSKTGQGTIVSIFLRVLAYG